MYAVAASLLQTNKQYYFLRPHEDKTEFVTKSGRCTAPQAIGQRTRGQSSALLRPESVEIRRTSYLTQDQVRSIRRRLTRNMDICDRLTSLLLQFRRDLVTIFDPARTVRVEIGVQAKHYRLGSILGTLSKAHHGAPRSLEREWWLSRGIRQVMHKLFQGEMQMHPAHRGRKLRAMSSSRESLPANAFRAAACG